MNISNLLQKRNIVGELKSAGKEEVLKELAGVFATNNGDLVTDPMVKILLEREKLGSTGIGEGIAIPHGKIAGIENIHIGFGRSRTGVEFNALDGKPVYLFFVLLAPEASSGQHLKALAKISRMLMDHQFRADLMKAESVDAIFSVIEEMDHRIV
jgi:PTS system nitrogen regulatory IIA component